MHSDPALVKRIEPIADGHGLQRKAMFGGYCWFRRGHITCGVWHANLILRLGEDAALAALDRDHVVPMDITGKPMRAWAMVEPAGCKTVRQLRGWIDKAVAFADTLPAKPDVKPKKRSKTRAVRGSAVR